jgi:predicted lipoprotein with Yx(FWY)xxD motif
MLYRDAAVASSLGQTRRVIRRAGKRLGANKGVSVMKTPLASFVVLSVLCCPGLMAAAQAAPATKIETTAKGKVLADAKGMTLYVNDRDKGGKSSCTGRCAGNWPPFRPAGGATASGNWTIITRSDGSKQWALDGKPLYTWSKDKKPGDMTGDGVAKIWHVARPV